MRWVRRLAWLHSHLALLLAPWLAMYALSSVVYQHSGVVGAASRALAGGGRDEWRPRFEAPLPLELPPRDADRAALQAFGWRAAEALGLDCVNAVTAWRDGPGKGRGASRLETSCFDAWSWVRLRFDPGKGVVRGDDRRFRVDRFLTGLHARAGWFRPGAAQKLWAGVVDVVGAAMLLWAATGLVVWLARPGPRRGAIAALGLGAAAAGVFVAAL